MNSSFRRFSIISVLMIFSFFFLTYSTMPVMAATPSDYEEALNNSSDYLISVQDSSGFWGKEPGDSWDADAENATGNAVTALVEAYQRTGDAMYLDAARTGGDYLIDVFIATDGSFDLHQAEIIGGNAYMNHLSPFLTAWIKLYQATDEQNYLDAAIAFGNYLLTNGARCTEEAFDNYGLFGYLIRPEDYWGPGYGAFGPECPFYHGHYLSYGNEQIYGLALLSEITGNADYLEAAELGAQQEIKYQKADGSFPAEMPDTGTLGIHYGSAKVLAYGKLYDITGVDLYKDALVAYVGWLLTQRNPDSSFGNPDYVRSTTWAVKALLEAWRLTYSSSYLVAAQAGAGWLLETGHGYDPATGEVVRYDKSADVYVAYSQTPFVMMMAELLVRPTLTNLYYGDVPLSGGFQADHFPQVWDLTACDMVISFTYDANGLVDDFGGNAHAWAELGVRQVGYGDFNPTWMEEGAGVWLATDYEWTQNTFEPDLPGSPTQDLDDKLILQRGGGMDESYYDLPSPPPNPWANHGIWFDRDGVDQWQAQMWGAIDGGTYNTDGTYEIVIRLHADNATAGTAYMIVNGVQQGFYVPNWHDGAPDLYPAGMSFSGDMAQMQVFYGLYGYGPDGVTHSVVFKDITAEGCIVLEDGMATGGGWFIPEENTAVGLANLGGKATFGFVAKQMKGTSSGQLEFQYHADELNLKSTRYDWVTVSNTQVIFQGEGRLNEEPGYKFRLHAFDGDKTGEGVDRFTIRIWTGNNDSYTMPTYRAEGALSGGNIVVHKK